MHYRNFGTSSNDTTGEKGGGHHCTVRWTTCRGKPLSSPKGWGCEIIPMHKAIQSPCLYSGNSLVPSEGRATPPSPHPGDHHPRHRKNRGPSTGSISAEEENTMSLLISAYKRTLRPPPRTAAAAARGRLLTCKKVGNAPYSSVPQSTWVTSPRHPGGREASAAARRASLLSCRRQRLPHPGPARRAARGPDRGRAEGARGEPRLRSRAARPPPAPGPGALSRTSRSRARGKAGPGPRVLRWRRGRGPQSLRRRGRPEPWGSREGSASLPSPPGRLGPTAACASSGWRFDWAGPGPPARGGPNPAGAQARSRGRQGAGCGAGRPAGGRAACCGCAGAEIAGDCAVGHSPQSGCATVGLRRGDCDRAGSSQPPATSGNGERCRLCRRRRRRGGGGEGEGARTRRTGSASPPGGRHDGEVGAASAAPARRGFRASILPGPRGLLEPTFSLKGLDGAGTMKATGLVKCGLSGKWRRQPKMVANLEIVTFLAPNPENYITS